MPDADFRSTAVSGKPIALSDLMFGANPLEPDLSQAATADTLAEIIQRVFQVNRSFGQPIALSDLMFRESLEPDLSQAPLRTRLPK